MDLSSPILKAIVVRWNKSIENLQSNSQLLQNEFGNLRLNEINLEGLEYQNSFIRASEVPAVINNKNYLNRELQIEEVKKKLGMTLYYLFEDGSLVEFDKILFHEYGKNVHLDLLPLLKGVYDQKINLEDYYWVPKEFRLDLKYGDLEYAFLRVLKNAQIMIANRRIQFFVSSHPFELDVKDMKVSKIQYIQFSNCTEENEIQISCEQKQVSNTRFHFSIKPSFQHDVLFRNAFINFEYQKLIFHNNNVLFSSIDKFVIEHIEKKNFKDEHSMFFIREESFEFEPHNQSQLIECLKFFRDHIADFHGTNIGFDHDNMTIAFDDIKGNLNIIKGEKFELSLEFTSKSGRKIKLFNFDPFMQTLIHSFEEGIKGCLERRAYQFDSRNARRNKDLKLTRHLGISAYLVFELFNSALKGKSSEGVEYADEKEFKDFLFKKMCQFLSSSEGNLNTDKLNLICSSTLLKAIEDLISDFRVYANDNLTVFIDGVEYILENANRKYIELIANIINGIFNRSLGDCFAKSRTNFFPIALVYDQEEKKYITDCSFETGMEGDESFQLDAYALYSKGLKRLIFVNDLFKLTDKNWTLTADNKEIEILEREDFEWQFELEEAETANEKITGKQKIDWFALHPKFFLKGQEVDFDNARMLNQGEWLEFNGKFFVLKDNDLPEVKVLEKFWQKIANKKLEKKNEEKNSPYYTLDKSYSLELLALRSMGVKIKGGGEWKEICEFYDSMIQGDRSPIFKGNLNGELKPYQSRGLRWLQDIYELKLGGILADDMGLGKTLQALTFLDSLRGEEKLGKCLILVPTSLIYNWMSESKRFTPDLRMISFNSKEKEQLTALMEEEDQVIVLSTYGLFTEHEEYFQEFKWNIHIFDEAQNLKNIVTKRTTAVRRLPAKFKLCLTGTPLENHLGEFFSLLDLCVPGSLGSYEEFKKLYVNPQNIEPSDIKYLRMKSRPLVLRRTKSEILKELPEKTITLMKIPFSDEQRKIYRDVALSWNEKVKDSIKEVGEAKSQMIMLTALLRLRQVCSDPAALPGVSFKNDPPKLQLLKDTLESIVDAGESAIVFTQFIPTMERIKAGLKKRNIPCFSIDGRSSKTQRENTLKGFSEMEEGCVLVMTLKTGGVGLNLTKASYVFHLEPWWNPAVENQATDRVHRLGQNRAVQVYRYIMEESVEEKIEQLKERKSAYFNSLFENIEDEDQMNFNNKTGLSQEDFEFLLS